MLIKKCLQCNKEFKTYHQRVIYCSRICKGLASRKPKISRICRECLKQFFIIPSRLKHGNGLTFCSWECYQKQPTRYWLGKKRPEVKHFVNFGVKKGHIPWNKGKKGEYTIAWSDKTKETWQKMWEYYRKKTFEKGKMSYRRLHKYIEKFLGKPDTCEYCGESKLYGHQIHWANKSKNYNHNIGDWIRLCVKCHKAYDKQSKTLVESYSN